MVTRFATLSVVVFCAGCLTSVPQPPKTWSIDPVVHDVASDVAEGRQSAFATTRLGSVSVAAPCDRTSFMVRRADGSVAFDPCNAFAAPPASLMKVPVMSCLAADGRFGRVVGQSSVATADAAVEVLVRDLSLDCRTEGRRMARAEVRLDVINTSRGPRAVVFAADGVGEADAGNGNYSAAFSAALDSAIVTALRSLK